VQECFASFSYLLELFVRLIAQEQSSQIEQLLAGQPDRRKAVFGQQLQNQVRIPLIIFLFARFRRTDLRGMADSTFDS